MNPIVVFATIEGPHRRQRPLCGAARSNCAQEWSVQRILLLRGPADARYPALDSLLLTLPGVFGMEYFVVRQIDVGVAVEVKPGLAFVGGFDEPGFVVRAAEA